MTLPPALLENLITKKDLQDVLNSVDQILTDLYQQKKQLTLSDTFSALAKSQQVDPKDREQLRAFFEDLKKQLTQIPAIGLTLGFHPSPESMRTIAGWIHTNVSENLILDISVDESLLGGAAISFNGFYRDLSLKKSLEDAYKNNRDIFTGRLKPQN